ncbi:hypothetical protein ACOME3_008480 [Neoechinorhynchus agilis]
MRSALNVIYEDPNIADPTMYHTHLEYIIGGPLFTSTQRVCYCGSLLEHKKPEDLVNLVETGSFKCRPSFLYMKSEPVELKLNSAVWTYVSEDDIHHFASHGGRDKATNVFVERVQRLLFPVHIASYEFNSYTDHQIIQFTTGSIVQDSESIYTLDDLRSFIRFVRLREIALSESCEQFLMQYFVMKRSSSQGFIITRKHLAVITDMSKAIAKFNLEDIVQESDVVLSIYLYEECLNTVYGPHYSLVKSSDFHSKDSDMGNSIGRKNDERLFAFAGDLRKLLSTSIDEMKL